FGKGFPLVGTGNYETVPVGVFSERFVERVDALQIRVRVTDVVGDSHERVLDCVRGARAEYNVPGAEPVNECTAIASGTFRRVRPMPGRCPAGPVRMRPPATCAGRFAGDGMPLTCTGRRTCGRRSG